MPYKAQHELHKQAIRDDKIKVTNARLARTKAKKRLSNDYDSLKKDKMADKGKELYSKGKTIRGAAKTTKVMAAIGAFSLTMAANGKGIFGNRRVSIPTGKNKYTNVKPSTIFAGIGAVTLGSAIAKQTYDEHNNKKLRAYYNHSSKR